MQELVNLLLDVLREDVGVPPALEQQLVACLVLYQQLVQFLVGVVDGVLQLPLLFAMEL